MLRVVVEGTSGIPVCTALHHERPEGFGGRESRKRGDVVGERAEKATRVVTRVPSVSALVVREPVEARRNTINCVEHGVRVAGVAQVDQAAVGGVDKVGWKRLVVE